MPKRDEAERLFELTKIERTFWDRGLFPASMDEVGRGPLAGPVVTACVVMPKAPLLQYVNDSKKLSEKRREGLYGEIIAAAVAYGIGSADQSEIDDMNILNATKLAFERAYINMNYECSDILIDAVSGLKISPTLHSFVHGDALSYSIAAASIIAKVTRDRYMVSMHEIYPQYGFDKHKGYGTAQHMSALREHGPCPLHRASFIKNIEGIKRG